MWLHCVYTRELALTKRTRYNTTKPTMRTCAKRHRDRVLKRPQAGFHFQILNFHPKKPIN